MPGREGDGLFLSWFKIPLPPRAASVSCRALSRVAEQLGPAPGTSPSSRGCSKTRRGTGALRFLGALPQAGASHIRRSPTAASK